MGRELPRVKGRNWGEGAFRSCVSKIKRDGVGGQAGRQGCTSRNQALARGSFKASGRGDVKR